MRNDMPSVMSDRPRHHKGNYHQVRRVKPKSWCDIEDAPVTESMKIQYKSRCISKLPWVFHAPVLRYLESKVGTPWSEVWSDICNVVKSRRLRSYFKNAIRVDWNNSKFFVCPEGILRKVERKKVKFERKPRFLVVGDYIWLDGLWWRGEFEEIPEGELRLDDVNGMNIYGMIDRNDAMRAYGRPCFIRRKHSASKKEIRSIERMMS